MSFHNILVNILLEFTNEEFGTNGRTKATQGKLIREIPPTLARSLLWFSSCPGGRADKWLRLQAPGPEGVGSNMCSAPTSVTLDELHCLSVPQLCHLEEPGW